MSNDVVMQYSLLHCFDTVIVLFIIIIVIVSIIIIIITQEMFHPSISIYSFKKTLTDRNDAHGKNNKINQLK